MKFEVRDGRFAYPGQREILKNISLTAVPGSTITILGPNGAGKTTLLRCMLGFLHWTTGQTLLDGTDIRTMKPAALWRKAAYVPQAKSMVFPGTCFDMVLLGRSAYLSLFGIPGKKDREIAMHAMERAGVAHLADRNCAEVSGGELQLVLIARALAAEPELLILDEPETGLDFRNQLVVMNLIGRLCAEEGLAAILNTHYPEHAVSMNGDTLLLFNDGSHVFGKTSEILTAENMRAAFGVEVRMREENIGGKRYTSLIPVNLVPTVQNPGIRTGGQA